MALLNQYVQTYGQIKTFFDTIREGQAPEKVTRQYLKDLGFTSSNHHALIPLLKGLGFLTADGTPTRRYKDYLDKTRSKAVLGEALREAYRDIFTIKSKPTKSDRDVIAGKFKSTYNQTERVAQLCTSTFLALLEIADVETAAPGKKPVAEEVEADLSAEREERPREGAGQGDKIVGLHYNIQIHLPATKDIEVYNAIFKSIKAHLID